MYARDLMFWLHERLADIGTLEESQKRFESLRGYGLLPRGRENAAVRLLDEQVAHAVLGFCHPKPGFAGHAALIWGDLRPVGGPSDPIAHASTLKGAIAVMIASEDAESNLLRLTMSVEQDFGDEEYSAVLLCKQNGKTHAIPFVSKYACSLLSPGAEVGYDHHRLDKLTAVQRSFGPSFFRSLSRDLFISRDMQMPLKTDWREYETEEEKDEFHRRLGAKKSSRFLNLRVEARVTWPKEPTRMQFGGHHLVLFPRTKENSNSISIDLRNERISANEAVSLINRLLSIMSWCENQPSSVHEGWSGNLVPVPVPRQNLAMRTMHGWHFYRSLPKDAELLKCLAYYRDGLNARSVGLASHSFLSFFRVCETRYDNKAKMIRWINDRYSEAVSTPDEAGVAIVESDRKSKGVNHGTYIYENCRVATAHAARDRPSDPDSSEELQRLMSASEIMQKLARYFIRQQFEVSDSYLTDDSK